jgi:tRNA-dihydrouridine synthase
MLMKTNIWQSLPKPFFVQAPMDDVTDTVFRQIIAMCGKPDIFFTEFTNAEAMNSRGRKRVEKKLQFTDLEKPIIAQIWGKTPENYFKTAKILEEMKFDGIDINMGCPQKDVVKAGNGGAMIKSPNLAKEIIQATKEGAKNLPISVKTRIGYSVIQTEEWIGFLLEQNLDALTVHGRTVREMSKVETHWDEIGKCVGLRNKIYPSTLIIGNGDVKSHAEGLEKHKKYGVDGIMIGRGILQNPWVFNPRIKFEEISLKEKLLLLEKHLKLFESTWGKNKDWNALKKFYKIYVSGFDNASEVRVEMMRFQTLEETKTFLQNLLQKHV